MGGGLLCANMGRCQNLLRLYPNSPLRFHPYQITFRSFRLKSWQIYQIYCNESDIYQSRCSLREIWFSTSCGWFEWNQQHCGVLHISFSSSMHPPLRTWVTKTMSFHDLFLFFKHTLYPSLSLCLAYFLFSAMHPPLKTWVTKTVYRLALQCIVRHWHWPYMDLRWPYSGLTWPYSGLTWPYMALQWPCMALQWPYMALQCNFMVLHGLTWSYMALHGLTWPYMALQCLFMNPSLVANQDSYANSISDCLARDLLGNKISKGRQSKTNNGQKKVILWSVCFYLDKMTYRICMMWCFKSGKIGDW